MQPSKNGWAPKEEKYHEGGGTCTSFGKIGHTQETCFADPKSGAYRPKGASKQRSVNKIQRSSTNAASKFCEKNCHTADTCKQKFHCNHCGKKGHLEATCTANPCSTCNKYYYKSANHRYHNCDGPAAQTKGALNNICQHIEHGDTEMETEQDTKFIGWNQTRDASDVRERNSHFFDSNGLHIDMSVDHYLPQTSTNEGPDEDYHFGSDNRFLGSSRCDPHSACQSPMSGRVACLNCAMTVLV